MLALSFIAPIALFTLVPAVTIVAADFLTKRVRPWSTFAAPPAAA
jgi:hypothetical protein